MGAKIFGQAITLYQIPQQVAHIFDTHVPGTVGFIIIVSLILLFIGLFLESMSMLLIMVPVLLPTVLGLGLDPIWFGVYFVLLIEIALITPPVGLNLFVIQAIAGTPLSTVVKGVLPFVLQALEEPAFRAGLEACCPNLASLSPKDLLQRYRDEVSISEMTRPMAGLLPMISGKTSVLTRSRRKLVTSC